MQQSKHLVIRKDRDEGDTEPGNKTKTPIPAPKARRNIVKRNSSEAV